MAQKRPFFPTGKVHRREACIAGNLRVRATRQQQHPHFVAAMAADVVQWAPPLHILTLHDGVPAPGNIY